MGDTRVLYCHCAFARVVPAEVKQEVLAGLTGAGRAFDAAPDLCELAARKDPSLQRLVQGEGDLDIVACYPRAVKWLFHAADVSLPEEGVHIHNMRTEGATEIMNAVIGGKRTSDSESSKGEK